MQNVKPKLVVLSATGQCGIALLKQLSKLDVDVVATSRNPEKAPKFQNVRWIKANPK